MTKSLLTLLFSIALSTIAFAQAEIDDLKNSFEEYFQAITQKENSKALDFMHPKLFETIPREMILRGMESMQADTAVVTVIDSATINKVSETLELDGVKYALVNYSVKMHMTFVSHQSDSVNFASEAARFTNEVLTEQYGRKNVIYDQTKGTLDIKATNEMYVIKDPIYDGWKFLEKKDHMKSILEMILPKKVLQRL